MSQRVIDILNQARARELTAIQQYMFQHYELEDAGFGKLAYRLKEIALVEMKHAEALSLRILMLDGVPTSQPEGAPHKGEEIPTALQTDIALEEQAVALYNEAAAICEAEKDQASLALFVDLLKTETEHLMEFEQTADHVAQLGAAYLATLVGC